MREVHKRPFELSFNTSCKVDFRGSRVTSDGGTGYGKRFGAYLADQVFCEFFKNFAYASMFLEYPRYDRLAPGRTGKRFLQAPDPAVVAHREEGQAVPWRSS